MHYNSDDEYIAMRAEIERLRAALQTIADGDDGMDSYTAKGMQNLAREVLGINEQNAPDDDTSYDEVSTEQIRLMNEYAKKR